MPRDILSGVRRVLALLAVGLAGLGFGLTACGSSSDGGSPGTSQPRGVTGPPPTGSIATDTDAARTATNEDGDDYGGG